MSDFNFVFKEYSDEDNKIYEDVMKKIMQNIKNGMSFREAVDSIDIKDNELKGFIEDDALKILIAELCYVSKIPFEELADMLKLPLDTIRTANLEMLEDIALTLNNSFNKEGSGNA
ncbi:MAG TPA: hypothetical protein PKZ17_01195 [Thermodesulfovibrio thiophilus]|uniref:hypothetical protein n=1 Tax=Thermodesulfovibrio thiophilus TaxID=340095 RepID=UPI001843915F|nr:hypothetical protein [Thermodesulfovibrio thiophilus]HHW20324.1 hypothetical protein [Thermodesulfovibrio thiophilus]HOA82653.1 hypothetical protein [Thermodesulfovibrio thiophilus]HQA03332.1 hypothetical protein [Thermodesulfovibrio thiophilus]HQD35742.1 hypothetical protein [Thermodesulfovibrio thiophilus]